MTTPFLEPAAPRLAAAAPTPLFEEPEDALSDRDRDLDALCESWVAWCRSRRLYGPSPRLGSILGQLSGKSSRPMTPGGPDAISSAELSAFHIAYTCQPDALDKQVFDLYYVHRVKPVKQAAAVLGISRKHFYDVLGDFRRRVAAAAAALAQENADALCQMVARRAARTVSHEDADVSTPKVSPPEVTKQCSPTGDTLPQNWPQFR